ncbi:MULTISPECIES: YopX family protein [Campylobacter]|uniref:YopX family protein n=1 Tax=Campylobacter TaxID=194 RepID=UPI0014700C32|nr:MULTISPECIES: YopX family protein [Campylobacter]MDU6827789.1 YopX family protein [Campylobacter sp.]
MNKAKYKIWTGGYMLKPDGHPLFFPFYVGAFDGKVYQGELEKGEYSLIETSFLALPYIGLQDKNEVEIAVGDIVKKSSGAIGQVVYLKATASYKLYNDGQIFDLFEADARYFEVVGNIYENPKMLKG